LISWKYSFEKVSRELELAKKKKQALDNLFSTGKISQSTYDDLNGGLTEAIVEIEVRQKALAEKMASKITDLERQISTLEKFLANTEIEYAAGEIDEELHERESGALILGLETAKQQLNVIKEAMADLFSEETEVVSPPSPPKTVEKAGEETPEVPSESETEARVEEPQEAEPATEEETYEQPVEAPATEESDTLAETPVEETLTETSAEEGHTEEEGFPAEDLAEESVTVGVDEVSEDVETAESAEYLEIEETDVSEEEDPTEE